MTDTMRRTRQVKRVVRKRYVRAGTERWTLREDQAFQVLLPWLTHRLRKERWGE